MGIGGGIALIVIGLILILNVIHLPSSWNNYVDSHTLGVILLVVGAIAVILVLIMNAQRQRTTHVTRDERDPRL